MLIAFSVENFRSIRDLQTLTMEPPRADEHLQAANTFELGGRRLLKSAAIFGPNASGKSNLLRALVWFRDFIRESASERQAGDPIEVVPFLLDERTEGAPSHFEIEFLLDEHEYRYGFRVDAKRVHSEWLFRRKPGAAKAAQFFTRERHEFSPLGEAFKEARGLESRTRANALFLSVCAQFNVAESVRIMDWVRRIVSISGLHDAPLLEQTAIQLKDLGKASSFLQFARKADFGITKIRSESRPSRLREVRLRDGHEIKLARSKRMLIGIVDEGFEFDLARDESQGTQKFIALAGPLLQALENGEIIVMDEFEARLHPRLTQALLDLFHGASNPRNAQLICATHDVTLLEPERFRRDQVWFCEKDDDGATRLYSLAEFDPKDVRPTTRFSKQYLLGLFGAVPRLAQLHESVAEMLAAAPDASDKR